MDCNEQNSEFWYNEEDVHGKVWKITESTITAAGCTTDFARIVIPHETAIHIGIYGIEIGIGITVSAVLITIFFEIAGQKDD